MSNPKNDVTIENVDGPIQVFYGNKGAVIEYTVEGKKIRSFHKYSNVGYKHNLEECIKDVIDSGVDAKTYTVIDIQKSGISYWQGSKADLNKMKKKLYGKKIK